MVFLFNVNRNLRLKNEVGLIDVSFFDKLKIRENKRLFKWFCNLKYLCSGVDLFLGFS